MASKEKTLEDLFYETLKDMYSAEKQPVTALGQMAKKAESKVLSRAFENHRAETQGHVERLEQVFELLEKPTRGKTCEAIKGLVEEGQGSHEGFQRQRRA
jgi:ferritin-like metal-binding protein YciE